MGCSRNYWSECSKFLPHWAAGSADWRLLFRRSALFSGIFVAGVPGLGQMVIQLLLGLRWGGPVCCLFKSSDLTGKFFLLLDRQLIGDGAHQLFCLSYNDSWWDVYWVLLPPEFLYFFLFVSFCNPFWVHCDSSSYVWSEPFAEAFITCYDLSLKWPFFPLEEVRLQWIDIK